MCWPAPSVSTRPMRTRDPESVPSTSHASRPEEAPHCHVRSASMVLTTRGFPISGLSAKSACQERRYVAATSRSVWPAWRKCSQKSTRARTERVSTTIVGASPPEAVHVSVSEITKSPASRGVHEKREVSLSPGVSSGGEYEAIGDAAAWPLRSTEERETTAEPDEERSLEAATVKAMVLPDSTWKTSPHAGVGSTKRTGSSANCTAKVVRCEHAHVTVPRPCASPAASSTGDTDATRHPLLLHGPPESGDADEGAPGTAAPAQCTHWIRRPDSAAEACSAESTAVSIGTVIRISAGRSIKAAGEVLDVRDTTAVTVPERSRSPAAMAVARRAKTSWAST
mmetsp:Transcript_33070/g.78323  ORF Transcript_33070/g.78323 Transcript_33070/m.78323 type:complete len:340 (-) Transcript_33070:1377-2396(-)